MAAARSVEQDIFEKGSVTYYFSSKLFPKEIREDVYRLYSFVRVVDDYVDAWPQKTQEFLTICRAWDLARTNPRFDLKRLPADSIDDRVIKNIVYLCREYKFDQQWVEAFLSSMQSDIDLKTYKTLDEALVYVYGSAEVVGLMMCRILGLPEEALPYARLQGRAMQWINFLRDIAEDNQLGRQYFPQDDLNLYHLPDLTAQTARANPELFAQFVQMQLGHYWDWQAQAEEGYQYIPKRARVALQTAVDMYDWTAKQIEKNPLVIYEKKIVPTKRQVGRHGLKNILKP